LEEGKALEWWKDRRAARSRVKITMRERIIFNTTLERIVTHTPTVKSFFLRLPPGQKLEFRAGQFISVHIPRNNTIVRKQYSIASPPMDPTLLELCIKRVEGGFISNAFFSYSPGATIPIDGPHGVFIVRTRPVADLFFIGTGTGISPLRSIILWLLHEQFSNRITLIFGVRNENEILYEKEFRLLAEQHPNFFFIPTISRPVQWKGERGHVQDHLEKVVSNPDGKEVYICGLPPMVNAVKSKLKLIGFDRKQIHYEEYV